MSKTDPVNICPRRRGCSKTTIALNAVVLQILKDFDISMSTRQMYYQLVSRGAVENSQRAYGRVARLLVSMRRNGEIDYDRIVDRTRSKHQRASWDGAIAILGACATQYRRNLWADQKTVVQIACEKQALEGIFADVVDDYGVSLWVVRGFSSESFVYEWATEIKRLTDTGKEVLVYYFGDFDPSGLAIEENTRDRLIEFGAEFHWRRAGLLRSDFENFNLVNVPIKATDTRSPGYFDLYGNRAAELDALPPNELTARIKSLIRRNIESDAWDRLRKREEVERESISTVVKHWDVALRAVSEVA